MSKIKSIIAKEIKDSRGKPTVEVVLETDKGEFLAAVPSGASTGTREAVELRDEDGGVSRATKNVNKLIAPKLKNLNPENQKEIDKIMIELDGTENKSKLGANAILAVSMAVCRAGATAQKVPLYRHIASLRGAQRRSNLKTDEIASHSLAMTMPKPMFNILNGGAHVPPQRDPATGGTIHLDIQEFMIVPQKKTMAENLVIGSEVFNKLKEEIKNSFGEDHLEFGDEGGFAPPISSAERALIFLRGASESQDVKFALDCAASEFYKNGKYNLEGKELTRSQLLEFYKNLVQQFPIISIEDPFAQDDWNGFEEIMRYYATSRSSMLVVGDDLTTTNIKTIKEAHNKKAINAVLIKLNQIGTVSETIEAINMTKSFGWKAIVSHRSGETMDNFIADLAVGAGAEFLKAGSPAKEERMVKYQRVVEIERELKI